MNDAEWGADWSQTYVDNLVPSAPKSSSCNDQKSVIDFRSAARDRLATWHVGLGQIWKRQKSAAKIQDIRRRWAERQARILARAIEPSDGIKSRGVRL